VRWWRKYAEDPKFYPANLWSSTLLRSPGVMITRFKSLATFSPHLKGRVAFLQELGQIEECAWMTHHGGTVSFSLCVDNYLAWPKLPIHMGKSSLQTDLTVTEQYPWTEIVFLSHLRTCLLYPNYECTRAEDNVVCPIGKDERWWMSFETSGRFQNQIQLPE